MKHLFNFHFWYFLGEDLYFPVDFIKLYCCILVFPTFSLHTRILLIEIAQSNDTKQRRRLLLLCRQVLDHLVYEGNNIFWFTPSKNIDWVRNAYSSVKKLQQNLRGNITRNDKHLNSIHSLTFVFIIAIFNCGFQLLVSDWQRMDCTIICKIVSWRKKFYKSMQTLMYVHECATSILSKISRGHTLKTV